MGAGRCADGAFHLFLRLIAQNAEPAAWHRFERALRSTAGKTVFAHAEEGEMIVQQPLQKRDRLGEFLDRNRRRVLLIVVDGFAQPLLHDAPVDHRLAHIGEDGAEIGFESAASSAARRARWIWMKLSRVVVPSAAGFAASRGACPKDRV